MMYACLTRTAPPLACHALIILILAQDVISSVLIHWLLSSGHSPAVSLE